MANVPPNDPNVDAPAIVPAPVNPDQAPAQPVGLEDGFAPHWIGNNIPNNQNGWIEEDAKEEEENPEEDPKEDPEEEPEDNDDDMEMDDEAEVIDPYMDDGSNNPPPPNSEDEETPLTSPVIPDADGQPIPPSASFGQNFHFGCDNIETDRTVRNVMSDLSGVKKLVKGLSDRFDEYERSKVFDAKRVLENELVNERNAKEFYREFGEYMFRMLQNRQKSEGSFPLHFRSDAAITDAAIADDTAPIDSQPHEPLRFLLPTTKDMCIDIRKMFSTRKVMRWELEAKNRTLGENERVIWMEARKAWLDKEAEYRREEVVISSDKVEGSGDWNLPEFQDTANTEKKKEHKDMVFHKIDTEELCLEHEVRRGNKVVKKELIIVLRGEIYFVKFIINPKEDDMEPGVIFGRSFLLLTKAITDFEVGTITIYPDIDPFLEETEEEGKSSYGWDDLLDFDFDDIPLLLREEPQKFMCKIGKSTRNKKKSIENLNCLYHDIGTSSLAGGHLTQEATKEDLATKMSQKFALLEEARAVIETMAYLDKYKKILDEVGKVKIELDGTVDKKEKEAVKKIKAEALKEKKNPEAFIFPIRLKGQINKNRLADTGSDINTMPYRIYKQLGREDMKKVDRGIMMINHTQTESMGMLTNVLCQVGVTTLIAKFLILDIPIDRDALIVVGRGFLSTIGGIVNTSEKLFSTFDEFCHQTFRAAKSDVIRNAESDSDNEEDYQIKRNKFGSAHLWITTCIIPEL
nr:hypothetical protein [Tanacetum cinerariifolium]